MTSKLYTIFFVKKKVAIEYYKVCYWVCPKALRVKLVFCLCYRPLNIVFKMYYPKPRNRYRVADHYKKSLKIPKG